jgi:TolA-binding protein
MEHTLVALGVAGAVLTTSTATSAAAAGGAAVAGGAAAGGAASGGAKAVSATLLVKWIGIGVVSGVGLASAAAVVTSPKASTVSTQVAAPPPQVFSAGKIGVAAPLPIAPPEAAPAPEIAASVVVPPPHVSAPERVVEAPAMDVGAPLAAEVAYVDRARSLVASGQSEQGLSQLRNYERQFPEARLLPEVLFLQLETLDRLGRASEARLAAQRLVDGFPKSPHATRARKLLIP